jgi:plastocyanin
MNAPHADPAVRRRRTPSVNPARRAWAPMCVLAALAACGGTYKGPAGPAHPTETVVTAPSGGERSVPPGTDPADRAPRRTGPVAEKAQGLREAADLLDKADRSLADGNRDLAEMLFSSAELLTGPEALAPVAGKFRQGAPPRVTTPTIKVADAGKQPEAVGNSDEDEPAAKPERSSLTGEIQINGKAPAGAIGIVTLEPVGGKWKPRAPKQRVMEQRNREFAPHVLAVPVGSTVTFPNYDSIYHNVFSRSIAKMFDLGLYKKGEARQVTFDKEGIVHISCNLHANMSAYVVVVAAPHYAITGDDGAFAFKSLRPGKYTLKAWSEKSKLPVTQTVVVKRGANKVEVGVSADAPEGAQPDKFGVARGKSW